MIWSPYLINEIELIEKVQRRFTKRLRGFNNLSYGSRLARLGLCTSELRRLHFDLMFCYKIVFGLVHVNCDDFFTFATSANTRGHDYKLYIPYRSSNLRKKILH